MLALEHIDQRLGRIISTLPSKMLAESGSPHRRLNRGMMPRLAGRRSRMERKERRRQSFTFAVHRGHVREQVHRAEAPVDAAHAKMLRDGVLECVLRQRWRLGISDCCCKPSEGGWLCVCKCWRDFQSWGSV